MAADQWLMFPENNVNKQSSFVNFAGKPFVKAHNCDISRYIYAMYYVHRFGCVGNFVCMDTCLYIPFPGINLRETFQPENPNLVLSQTLLLDILDHSIPYLCLILFWIVSKLWCELLGSDSLALLQKLYVRLSLQWRHNEHDGVSN